MDNKTAELDIELIVQQGRGYVPVEQRESEKLEIGMIAIDAIYTPIKNVNYEFRMFVLVRSQTLTSLPSQWKPMVP